MSNESAEEKQLAQRFWAIYKEEDLKYGEDYHDAADVRILAEQALNRFIKESQSTISRLESESRELRKEIEELRRVRTNEVDFWQSAHKTVAKERDSLKKELEEAKELLKEVVEANQNGYNAPEWTVQAIESFLKDK